MSKLKEQKLNEATNEFDEETRERSEKSTTVKVLRNKVLVSTV